MIQGKLSEVIFPYLETNPKERPQNIIIFIVGGITYEEAAVVAELNAQYQDVSILLGGNVIHNSKSFLADVMQLGRLA
jgi:vacuolar protein sorting-associated protein 45